MTDVDLDLILPPQIELRHGDGPIIATIPGELPMVEMLQVVRLQEEGKRHERFLLDTPNTMDFAEEREIAEIGVREFYEQCAAFIQQHAQMVEEGALLELTATQIVTIISLLGAPQERARLIGEALLRALDLGPEDENDVPLDEGSPATSSPSDEPAAGKARTGARSRGASSSRSAPKSSASKT